MTDQPTTPADDAKTTAPRKAPVKKAPAKKKEFAPKLTDGGKLSHEACGHDRTPKGRAACRAEYAKMAK